MRKSTSQSEKYLENEPTKENSENKLSHEPKITPSDYAIVAKLRGNMFKKSITIKICQ